MPRTTGDGERVDEPRQVLARLDGADIQHEPRRQAVLRAHAIEPGAIVDRPKRRTGRFVDHGDAIRRHAVKAQQIAPGAVRHRDDRGRLPNRHVHQRPIQQQPPHRMTVRIQPQAHVVDGHDGRHRRADRDHAVGEMRHVGPQRLERARRAHLHPADAHREAMALVHAHVRRQRPLGVDRLVRHHDDLVAGVLHFAGEVLQQVLGVVPDTGAPGRQRRAVKRDAHVGRASPRPGRRPRRLT